ncbi:histone-lysine N-methyltransferase [Spizellomyces sp. 'palustris']|nr:histone-lysine N-methyltransferase [Spizellomyces sp. 'palustris']
MEQPKIHKRIYSNTPRSPPKRHLYVPVRHPPSPSSDLFEKSGEETVHTVVKEDESDSTKYSVLLPVSATVQRDHTPDSTVSEVFADGSRGNAGSQNLSMSNGCDNSRDSQVSTPSSIDKFRRRNPISPVTSGSSTAGDSPEPNKPGLDHETIAGCDSEPTNEKDRRLSKEHTTMASKISSKRKRSCDLSAEPPRKGFVQKDVNVEEGNCANAVKGTEGTAKTTNRKTPATTKQKIKRRKDHRHLSKRAMEPCISALDIVKENLKLYSLQGGTRVREESDLETIELQYPGENASEIFPLVVSKKALEYNPVKDIYVTTQIIIENCLKDEHAARFGDTRSGILRSIQKACNRKNAEDLKAGIAAWNEEMSALKKKKIFASREFTGPAASYPMIAHILEQAYSRSVAPSSSLLNNYEGFSNNVYGEVKHNFVNTIIKEANIQPNYVFVDMGSGIGNVVLQVAAQCLCDSYGIEIMETPAKLAAKQKKEFVSRMRYYAKPCGRITLKHTDFLEDNEMHEVIKKADVIFVNNYAFSAELNQMILAKFLDLKENAIVIALRSFVPVDRPTARSARRSNAIESIFRVKEHYFGRDNVSWMNEGGQYYIHTVDRQQLAKLSR